MESYSVVYARPGVWEEMNYRDMVIEQYRQAAEKYRLRIAEKKRSKVPQPEDLVSFEGETVTRARMDLLLERKKKSYEFRKEVRAIRQYQLETARITEAEKRSKKNKIKAPKKKAAEEEHSFLVRLALEESGILREYCPPMLSDKQKKYKKKEKLIFDTIRSETKRLRKMEKVKRAEKRQSATKKKVVAHTKNQGLVDRLSYILYMLGMQRQGYYREYNAFAFVQPTQYVMKLVAEEKKKYQLIQKKKETIRKNIEEYLRNREERKYDHEMDDLKADGNAATSKVAANTEISVGNIQEAGVPSSTVMADTKDFSFYDYTQKWNHVDSFKWKTSYGFDASIWSLSIFRDLLDKLSATTAIIPLANCQFFSADVELLFTMNTNQFSSGQMQISMNYGYQNVITSNEAGISVYSLSQKPHVLMNAGGEQEAILKIPFKYPMNMLKCTGIDSCGKANMGLVNARVLSPLQMKDDTPFEVQVFVSARLVNLKIAGMIDMAMRPLKDEEIDHEMMPALVNVAQKLLAPTNCDYPPMTVERKHILPTVSGSMSSGTNNSISTDILRLDPQSVTPHNYSTEDFAMERVLNTFGLIGRFTIDNTSAIGSVIYKREVSPLSNKTTYPKVILPDSTKAFETYALPPLAVMSSMYGYTRGSLDYRFDVVCTVFHACKLLISFIPGPIKRNYTSWSIQRFRNTHHQIYDILKEKTFCFTAPYVCDQSFYPRRSLATVGVQDFEPFGHIYVVVMSNLYTSDLISKKIDVLVYMKAGEDFEMSIPAQTMIQPSYDRLDSKMATYQQIQFLDGYFPAYQGTWHSLSRNGQYVPVLRYGTVSDHVCQLSLCHRYSVYQLDFGEKDQIDNWYISLSPVGDVSKYRTIRYIVPVFDGSYVYAVPFHSLANAVSVASLYAVSGGWGNLAKFVEAYVQSACVMYASDITCDYYDSKIGNLTFNFIQAFRPAELEYTDHETGAANMENYRQPGIDNTVSRLAKIHFGENTMILKDLCRRPQLYCSIDVDKPMPFLTVSVSIPVTPWGITLSDMSDDIMPVRTYLALIASGFLFMKGTLRFKVIAESDTKFWVQHRYDTYSIDEKATFYKDPNTSNLGLASGYAISIQDSQVNPIMDVEIPYYSPCNRVYANPTSATVSNSQYMRQMFNLGSIVLGCSKPSKFNVFYSLGDDAEFSEFIGFPPVMFALDAMNSEPIAFHHEMDTPSEQKMGDKVLTTVKGMWESVKSKKEEEPKPGPSREQVKEKPSMLTKVTDNLVGKTELGQSIQKTSEDVSNALKSVDEKVVPGITKVCDTISNFVSNLNIGTMAKDFFIGSKNFLLNIISNIMHCCVTRTVGHFLIAVSSILASLLPVGTRLINNIVDCVGGFIRRMGLKLIAPKAKTFTPMVEDLIKRVDSPFDFDPKTRNLLGDILTGMNDVLLTEMTNLQHITIYHMMLRMPEDSRKKLLLSTHYFNSVIIYEVFSTEYDANYLPPPDLIKYWEKEEAKIKEGKSINNLAIKRIPCNYVNMGEYSSRMRRMLEPFEETFMEIYTRKNKFLALDSIYDSQLMGEILDRKELRRLGQYEGPRPDYRPDFYQDTPEERRARDIRRMERSAFGHESEDETTTLAIDLVSAIITTASAVTDMSVSVHKRTKLQIAKDFIRKVPQYMRGGLNITGFMRTLWSTIQKCYAVVKHKIFPEEKLTCSMLDKFPDVKEWVDECDFLLHPDRWEPIKVKHALLQRVDAAVYMGTNIMCLLNMNKKYSNSKTFIYVIETYYKKITDLKKRCHQEKLDFKTAYEPFMLYVWGKPGLGKTYIKDNLIQNMAKTCKITTDGPLVYDVPMNSSYWTNCAKQPFCYVDDFNLTTDSVMALQMYSDICQLKSCNTFTPNQAAVEDKGRTYSPDVVYVNSNMEKPEINGVGDLGAFLRRPDLYVQVALRDHLVAKGKSLYTQLNILERGRPGKFEYLKFGIAQREGTLGKDSQFAYKWYGYTDFMTILLTKLIAYRMKENAEVEKRLKTNLAAMDDEEMKVRATKFLRPDLAKLTEEGIYRVLEMEVTKETDKTSTVIESTLNLVQSVTDQAGSINDHDEYKEIKKIHEEESEYVYDPMREPVELLESATVTKNVAKFERRLAKMREHKKEEKQQIPIGKLNGELLAVTEEPQGHLQQVFHHETLIQLSGMCDVCVTDDNDVETIDSTEVDKKVKKVHEDLKTTKVLKPYVLMGSTSQAYVYFMQEQEGVNVDVFRVLKDVTVMNGHQASFDALYEWNTVKFSEMYTKENVPTPFKRKHIQILEKHSNLKKAYDDYVCSAKEGLAKFWEKTKSVFAKTYDFICKYKWVFMALSLVLGIGTVVLSMVKPGLVSDKCVAGVVAGSMVSRAVSRYALIGDDTRKMPKCTPAPELLQPESWSMDKPNYAGARKAFARSYNFVQHQSSGPLSPDIVQRVKKNTFWLNIYYGTEVVHSMRILAIGGRKVLMPLHYLECLEKYKIKTGYRVVVCKENFSVNVPLKTINLGEKFKETSLRMLEMPPAFPMCKNIDSFVFKGDKANLPPDTAYLLIIGPSQITAFNVSYTIESSTVQASDKGSEVHIKKGYRYPHHGPGLCGSVFIVNNKICGMHVAGGNNIGISEPMSDYVYAHEADLEDIPEEWLEKEDMTKPFEGNFLSEGTVTSKMASYNPTETAYFETPLSHIFSIPVAPATLSHFEYENVTYSPLYTGVMENCKPNKDFPEDAINAAVKNYAHTVITAAKPLRSQVGVMTYAQAKDGLPENSYYPAVDRTTSVGWPLSKNILGSNTKNGLLGEFGEPMRDSFRLYCEEFTRMRIRNVVPPTVFEDKLKDDLVSMDKVATPGGTRIISCCPLEYLINCRRYFQDFVVAMSSANFATESAVGIDPQSLDWTLLANRLGSRSPHIVDGDYKKFGPTLNAMVLNECKKIINNWYTTYGEYDPVANQVRNIMMDELINSRHLAGKHVYRTVCGAPSGSPMTVVLNGMVNSIYIRCVFWLLGLPIDSFSEKVTMITYGDDILMAIMPSIINEFNFLTISEMFRRYDIRFTPADKSEEAVPYADLHQVSFLKSRFRRIQDFNQIYVYALDLVSVAKMMKYNKRSKYETWEEIFTNNIIMAGSHLLLHGKKRYEEISEKVQRQLSCRTHYKLEYLDYDEALHEYLQRVPQGIRAESPYKITYVG